MYPEVTVGGYRGVAFPEYTTAALFDQDKNGKITRTISPQRFDLMREAYEEFKVFRTGLQSMGLPDDINGYGFDYMYDTRQTLYKAFVFDAYHRSLLKNIWTKNNSLFHKLTNLTLVSIDKEAPNVSNPNLGRKFLDAGNEFTAKQSLEGLIEFREEANQELKAHGIEANVDNFLKFWALKNFRYTSFGLTYFVDENGYTEYHERIFELMQFPICLEDCFTALSWYANIEHQDNGKFSYSPEVIASFQEFPAAFREHLYFAEVTELVQN